MSEVPVPGEIDVIDPDAPVFVISVAAVLAQMHPQTLRTYDRMGLVIPSRSRGRGRRYTRRDVDRLRLIQQLSQEEGINLEGIRRILQLQDELERLRAQVGELSAHLRTAYTTARGSTRVLTVDATGRVRPD